MTEAEIRNILKYHNVQGDQDVVAAMERVREVLTEAAVEVGKLTPPSRERSLFLTNIQQGQMMAIASLAIHGTPEGG